MMKKNVSHAEAIIISDNNLGFLGGERESQLIIINGLKKSFKIAVIQPGEFKESIENVDIYWRTKKKRLKQLLRNPISFIAYFFKLSKLINRINPLLIHSNSQASFFMVSMMKRMRLISRSICLIHTERGLYTKYTNFYKRLFFKSFKYVDLLITTTQFNLNCWKKANEQRKIFIEYQLIENTAGPVFETIDLSKVKKTGPLVVGFAGRMCDWKGWPLAERIIAKTAELDSSISFKAYVSCLDKKSTSDALRMFERINALIGERFIGKINVPFSYMDDFYYDIDLFILTSWKNSESFGRTIVEAMSRYTVVLTTDAGGSVEVVDDPNTIFDKPEEFVQCILWLNKNRGEMDNIKEKNYKRVKDVYSLENNIQKYKSAYTRFIKLT